MLRGALASLAFAAALLEPAFIGAAQTPDAGKQTAPAAPTQPQPPRPCQHQPRRNRQLLVRRLRLPLPRQSSNPELRLRQGRWNSADKDHPNAA